MQHVCFLASLVNSLPEAAQENAKSLCQLTGSKRRQRTSREDMLIVAFHVGWDLWQGSARNQALSFKFRVPPKEVCDTVSRSDDDDGTNDPQHAAEECEWCRLEI